jgi:Fe-S-cluster-containing dehydrogenase component
VEACPYHAIFWNAEKQVPQKCTFCVHRLEEGKVPRCAQICPSEAIKFGDLDDPKVKFTTCGIRKTEPLNPELKTRPNVVYLDVPKTFLAGSVVYSDKDECFEGASVTLSANGDLEN